MSHRSNAFDTMTEIRSQLKLISGRRFLLLRLRPHTVLFLIIDPEVDAFHEMECINVISTSEEMSVSSTHQ